MSVQHANEFNLDLKVNAMEWPHTSLEAAKPSKVRSVFHTFIYLEGKQRFQIDDKMFEIDAGHGKNCRPKAISFYLDRESELTLFRGELDALSKVRIILPPNWMDLMGLEQAARSRKLVDFMSGHLNHMIWEPGTEIVNHARQIKASQTQMTSEMAGFFKMARSMDIMGSICDVLGRETTPTEAGLNLLSQRKVSLARDYIMDNLESVLTIEAIARAAGIGARSLQRKFKEKFGETIFDFIRSERLVVAHSALKYEGVAIAQAAYIAGYSSPSNFATAFKKKFGISPGLVRS